MAFTPKVGERRTYTDRVDVLYPGESAEFVADPHWLNSRVTMWVSSGLTPVNQTGDIDIPGTWVVTPTPGPVALFRRTRCRVVLWWQAWRSSSTPEKKPPSPGN